MLVLTDYNNSAQPNSSRSKAFYSNHLINRSAIYICKIIKSSSCALLMYLFVCVLIIQPTANIQFQSRISRLSPLMVINVSIRLLKSNSVVRSTYHFSNVRCVFSIVQSICWICSVHSCCSFSLHHTKKEMI